MCEFLSELRPRAKSQFLATCSKGSMSKKWILAFLSFALVHDVRAQRSCKLKDGSGGRCMPVKDCPSALELLKINQQAPICGYKGETPIVCCEAPPVLATISNAGKKSNENCYNIYISTNYGRLPGSGPPPTAVVGGYDSLAQEFPHMAVLGYGDNSTHPTWGCGGSLISKRFVLTAGHCLKSKDLGDVKYVRLGDLNLEKTDDKAEPQDFTVKRTIKHPEYKHPIQYNDIALIELDRDVIINDYVIPACLNTDRDTPSTFTATGWGHLKFGGTISYHLQKVMINYTDYGTCRQAFEVNARRLPNGILEDRQICAGAPKKDTCQGDSGGPLQRRNLDYERGHTIFGITSFGKACGISNSPGVYTRVSYYIEWIESEVWP
ncbi:PREDICTED: venom protease-like isoform X1 [Nicrophorus vespilloides]|uniref:CLIP domain-containing serine protease n=2 Tax=Nicrophorus vespilloides TaxID=110193 RepID=A0ABM1N3Y2_NICVS|nr:PREDICTED: venom protease-like isoform X1 [Nicrophorus vespilloides]